MTADEVAAWEFLAKSGQLRRYMRGERKYGRVLAHLAARVAAENGPVSPVEAAGGVSGP